MNGDISYGLHVQYSFHFFSSPFLRGRFDVLSFPLTKQYLHPDHLTLIFGFTFPVSTPSFGVAEGNPTWMVDRTTLCF